MQKLIRMCLMLCAFAGAARASDFPQRPSVLINADELSTLRRALAKPGWKRNVYRAERPFSVLDPGEGMRRNAELWLHREIEIPAYGGHFHHFFCEDGNRLELPPDQRFAPGPYRCPKCGRQYTGEKYEAAVRRLVHGWLAQAALDLALEANIEQRPDCATKSAEILLKYAKAYPGPHTANVTGGMIYQSLDEAMWVIPLAQAYDLVADTLSTDQRREIETFLNLVASGLEKSGTRGNWASWHLSAVGVIGYATHNQDLITWATDNFKRQIRDELGDDGLWPESVHTYHYFPLLAFIYFAEAAWHAGVDLYHWEAKPGKNLLSMFTAPLDYAYPNLRLPAINDGWFESFVPADIYELAWRRTKDPKFAWVVANGYRPDALPAGTVDSGKANGRTGFYALLFGGDIPRDTRPPEQRSINFPVLGICALRSTNGAMMTFDYGPYLGHGQPDKMGITLFANNQLWLADYGTPGYGSRILAWYRSTFAHNTIVVDNKNQNLTHENSAELWLEGQNFDGVRSESKDAYPGVTHSRSVVRSGDYFIIKDELRSAQKHTYDLYLHCEGTFSSAMQKTAFQKIKLPVEWIEEPRQHESAKTIEGRWDLKGHGIAFCVIGGGPMTPIEARCPAESGTRTIPLLIARQVGTAVEFSTVLAPYKKRLDLAVEQSGEEILVRSGGRTESIVMPKEGKPSVEARNLMQPKNVQR